MNKEFTTLEDAYKQVFNEGMFDRVAARTKGLGTMVSQGAKNIYHAASGKDVSKIKNVGQEGKLTSYVSLVKKFQSRLKDAAAKSKQQLQQYSSILGELKDDATKLGLLSEKRVADSIKELEGKVSVINDTINKLDGSLSAVVTGKTASLMGPNAKLPATETTPTPPPVPTPAEAKKDEETPDLELGNINVARGLNRSKSRRPKNSLGRVAPDSSYPNPNVRPAPTKTTSLALRNR